LCFSILSRCFHACLHSKGRWTLATIRTATPSSTHRSPECSRDFSGAARYHRTRDLWYSFPCEPLRSRLQRLHMARSVMAAMAWRDIDVIVITRGGVPLMAVIPVVRLLRIQFLHGLVNVSLMLVDLSRDRVLSWLVAPRPPCRRSQGLQAPAPLFFLHSRFTPTRQSAQLTWTTPVPHISRSTCFALL